MSDVASTLLESARARAMVKTSVSLAALAFDANMLGVYVWARRKELGKANVRPGKLSVHWVESLALPFYVVV